MRDAGLLRQLGHPSAPRSAWRHERREGPQPLASPHPQSWPLTGAGQWPTGQAAGGHGQASLGPLWGVSGAPDKNTWTLRRSLWFRTRTKRKNHTTTFLLSHLDPEIPRHITATLRPFTVRSRTKTGAGHGLRLPRDGVGGGGTATPHNEQVLREKAVCSLPCRKPRAHLLVKGEPVGGADLQARSSPACLLKRHLGATLPQ